MSKVIHTLVAILALSGCGYEERVHQRVLNLEPTIAPFITAFEQDAKSVGIDLHITDLEARLTDGFDGTDVIGECFYTSPKITPLIVLSRWWFSSVNDDYKTILVYHELGHCILHRGHKEGSIVLLGMPIISSIMNPVIFDDGMFRVNREYYIQELFYGN